MKNPELYKHIQGKFHIKCDTQCWEWSGTRCSSGRYGKVNGFKNKTVMAHRLSYEIHFGDIPKGFVVCHKCDNGVCINPDHLFIGTQKDNMRDCMEKGRMLGMFTDQRGQNNKNAKPDLENRYRKIRDDRVAGMSYSQIREKHGIKSNGHLRKILLKYGL